MASNPCEVATANEDEGYGSFLTASSSTTKTSGMAGENSAAGASRMSNVDLLIRVRCLTWIPKRVFTYSQWIFFVPVIRLPGSNRVKAC